MKVTKVHKENKRQFIQYGRPFSSVVMYIHEYNKNNI